MKSINLLPAKQKSVSKNPKLMPLLLIITLIALAAQFYYVMTWSAEKDGVGRESLQLNEEINAIRSNGDLKVKVEGYKQAEQLIAQLEEARTEWKPYLGAIIGNFPATTKIVSISADDQHKIKMELDFKAYDEVVDYMKKLEKDSKLQDVALTSFYKKVDEQTTAEIVPSGTNGGKAIQTTRKSVYKLMLDIMLTNDKGAE